MADGDRSMADSVDDGGAGSEHIEQYVIRLLDECRDEIRLSDSKASILFAAVATTSALLVNALLDNTNELRTNGTGVTVLAIGAISGLLAAMVLLGLAVMPRVGRPQRGQARYFEEHAQFDNSDDLLAVLSVDAKQASARHAQQIHVLSRIARRKFGHLRAAMFFTGMGMGVLAVAVLIALAT